MGRKLRLKKKTGGKEKPVKISTDFDTAMAGFLIINWQERNEKTKKS